MKERNFKLILENKSKVNTHAIQNELQNLTCMDSLDCEILYYETAFKFIERVSEERKMDMSSLISSNTFWNLWHRKWIEVDKLFLSRLEQQSHTTAYRIRDCKPNPASDKRRIERGDYYTPFFYKEKFGEDTEVVIFNISEMTYHWKTLHQSETVMSWAMASLINIYSLFSR